ncbi:MAG: DUF58 domain-containing protein [Rudaea sp.]|uniref:DUF58 domain-containing protein n=1 Tax=unclassified Rudaea TaxID=2627037 RepID=UPI0010F98E95|nr:MULTISPECIES: DUF58 domain-containing protein [unclassified Rudaea]MBN8884859.1 DUF58 domain-containing protein [Rudaea sp.]MBR0343933.1 DUF58 domain-containing protein [Rudaea sp.]
MSSTLTARKSTLLQMAERRLPALTRLKRTESLPILLHRRRIYVVPSRFGLIYSFMLLVMLIGALNYANNPGLLLTCLLGAAAYQSVFAGFRTLNRVELRSIRTQPCHAGDNLRLSLLFASAAAAPKRSLRLRMENAANANAETTPIVFDLPGDDSQAVETTLPAPRRGWLPIGRVRVWTEYPYGLFHVWSWLHPDQRALVYPRLETNAPALPQNGGEAQAQTARRNGDEFGLLREYRAGDPCRLIAWKASARQDHLLVKEFESQHSREIMLDWHRLDGLDDEARISRLAAWIERAETLQTPYLLQLPQIRLGPALGPAHRHACLRELALMPGHAT